MHKRGRRDQAWTEPTETVNRKSENSFANCLPISFNHDVNNRSVKSDKLCAVK